MPSFNRCFRTLRATAFFSGLGIVLLTGCGNPAREMMQARPSPRAEELNRLNMYVGTWEGVGECRFPGEATVYKATSVDKYAWAVDRTFLLNDLEVSRGESKGMVGRGAWTWDAQAKVYRNWWFDSDGSTANGTATYDEGSRTWHVQMESQNTLNGQRTWGSGVSRFVDAATIEWTWREWNNGMRMGKPLFEMNGTLRKKT